MRMNCRRSTFIRRLASSMLGLLLILAFLDVLTLGAVVTAGKEYVPDPELAVPAIPFGYSLNYQGNWCSRQEMLSNGTINDIRMAIAGETVTAALPNDTDYINFLPDGSLNPKNPGVYGMLMDEVARRGGFNWKFTIHEYLPSHHYVDAEGKEYFMTDLLVWLTQNFDVSMNWWLETVHRVSRGISFPKGWYDASIIIIGRKDATEAKFSAFSWGGPFSTGVWILLIVTLILTAVIVLMLEEGVTAPKLNLVEFEEFSSAIFLYIHKAFVVFTGHMDLQTRTIPGQLVSFSLCFFTMLMLSTYTANLASFLVSRNLDKSDVYTLDDIVKEGMSMCILNAAMKEVIQTEYPQARFVLKEKYDDIYVGLIDGECNYAISGVSGWEEYQSDQDGDCGLTRIGRVFRPFKAGFAMAAESGIHCTSMLREVFHIHLMEMYEDGFIGEVWNAHLRTTKNKRIGDKMCSTAVFSTNDGPQVLTLAHMGGAFLLHVCLIVIALISARMGKYYDLNWREKVVTSKIVNTISKKLSGRDLYSNIIQPKYESVQSSIMLDLSTSSNSKKNMSALTLSSSSGVHSFMDMDEGVGTGLGSDDIIFLREQLKVIMEKLDRMSLKESACINRSSPYVKDRSVTFLDQVA